MNQEAENKETDHTDTVQTEEKKGSGKPELEDRSMEGKSFTFHETESEADARQYLHVLEEAFSYRGDVTLQVKNGDVSGFIYDRQLKVEHSVITGHVRMIPTDGSGRQTIAFQDILGIKFSGKDTAFGKSWDAWVRRFEKLKATGEEASIYGEDLDDGAGQKQA